MGKSADLSPQLRERIVLLRKEGKSLRDISRLLKVSYGAVTHTLKVNMVVNFVK
jgi:DNA-binding CsgD family transcriptional regulator